MRLTDRRRLSIYYLQVLKISILLPIKKTEGTEAICVKRINYLFVCLFESSAASCLFVCSFVRSFVHSFVCLSFLLVCSFIRSFVCFFELFVCLFVCSFVHPFVCLFL